MWFLHLLGLLRTTWSYFWTAIGQTFMGWTLGIVTAVIVAVGTARHAAGPGLRAALHQWRKKASFAFKLSLLAAAVTYGLLWEFKFAQVVYDDHMGLVRRGQEQRSSLGGETRSLVVAIEGCKQSLANTQTKLDQKSALADGLQQGIVGLQGPQAQQAANIGSCITNLAKLNPQVRQHIEVVVVPFATESLNHSINPRPQEITNYMSEIFIITNVSQPAFHGSLRCAKAFIIEDEPAIQSSSARVSYPSTPVRINDSEYEIRAQASNTEWNPSHPAFFQIYSPNASVLPCAFTILE